MADFVELTQGGARKRPVLNDDDDTDEDDEDEDGKRKITYKMQKNKGFIPKRQKKRRNPRVKHRSTYIVRNKSVLSETCSPKNPVPYLQCLHSRVRRGSETTKGRRARGEEGDDQVRRRGEWHQDWLEEIGPNEILNRKRMSIVIMLCVLLWGRKGALGK